RLGGRKLGHCVLAMVRKQDRPWNHTVLLARIRTIGVDDRRGLVVDETRDLDDRDLFDLGVRLLCRLFARVRATPDGRAENGRDGNSGEYGLVQHDELLGLELLVRVSLAPLAPFGPTTVLGPGP